MPKLNAVDAISPAFTLTKLNLFTPWRWSFWWRIAVLGFLTGEISTGGGGASNFNIPAGFPPPQHRGDQLSLISRPFPNFDPHLLWTLLPAFILCAFLLVVVFLYLGSVCRFILLEAVLNGKVRIREAWGRWHAQGTRFFGFQLILHLVFLFIIGMVFVFFVLMIGISTLKGMGTEPPGARLGAVMGWLLLFGGVVFLLLIPYLVTFVLAKDFAVPVMALGGTTFGEAWQRVWRMVREEPVSVLAYLGMKIVLTIGAAFLFGILAVMVVFGFLLVFGGAGALTILAGKAVGLTWNVFTVTAVVCAILIIALLLIAAISLICVPVAVFFPSYGLYFFAGRYQPLHDRLFPPPPPAAVTEPPPIAPEPTIT